MTTCAWDGKTLATDTRSITNETIDQYPCQKIFKRKGTYCAVAGYAVPAISVAKYLLKKKGDPPDLLETPEEGMFEIILVSKDRAEHYSGSLDCSPIDGPFAIGSGSNYALAAMLCGKSAEEAIEIAAKLDANTGIDFGIQSYKVR